MIGKRQGDEMTDVAYKCTFSLRQWNLSVTTTSIIKFITCVYPVMFFNVDWRYQITLQVCNVPDDFL